MNRYKVSVTFAGQDHAFIIWELEAVCIELLIPDVVTKLRDWLGAKGMYLKKANECVYEIRLVTLCLGQVDIELVEPTQGIPIKIRVR